MFPYTRCEITREEAIDKIMQLLDEEWCTLEYLADSTYRSVFTISDIVKLLSYQYDIECKREGNKRLYKFRIKNEIR